MQKLTAEEGARVLSVLRDAGEGVSLLARLPLSRRNAEALAAKLGGAGAGADALLGAEVMRTAELEQAHRDMLKETAAAQRAAAAAAAAAQLEATLSGSSPPAAPEPDEATTPREDPALRSQYGLVLRLMRADLVAGKESERRRSRRLRGSKRLRIRARFDARARRERARARARARTSSVATRAVPN